jgi:hypothetical protein
VNYEDANGNGDVENDFDPLDANDCPSWMCGSSKIWRYLPNVSNKAELSKKLSKSPGVQR